MVGFHGNGAWGTANVIPPCSSGSRLAMTAALRLRLPLLVLFLLLRAAGLPQAEAQTTQLALPEAEAPALPLPTTRLGDFDMMKERRLIRILGRAADARLATCQKHQSFQ